MNTTYVQVLSTNYRRGSGKRRAYIGCLATHSLCQRIVRFHLQKSLKVNLLTVLASVSLHPTLSAVNAGRQKWQPTWLDRVDRQCRLSVLAYVAGFAFKLFRDWLANSKNRGGYGHRFQARRYPRNWTELYPERKTYVCRRWLTRVKSINALHDVMSWNARCCDVSIYNQGLF